MRINGTWTQCDDGVIRPLIAVRVAAANGEWVPAEFLIDTGADRTVFSAAILNQLGLPRLGTTEHLGGPGGTANSALVETQISVLNEAGAAVTDTTALDISVLGRDILDLFAVIVDRARNVVCLRSQRHTYAIIHE